MSLSGDDGGSGRGGRSPDRRAGFQRDRRSGRRFSSAVVCGAVFALGSGMTNLAGEKSSDRPAPYGQSVAYAGLSKTHPRLTFNDFSLQYVGLREVPGPNNAPWKMTVYRFHVQAREAQQEILWSSGSGLIAPSSFVVGHVRYLLELKHSEKQGKLPDGFLVVSPAGEAISKEEAVEIARKDAGQAVGSLARYEILAHPRPNGWHVDFVHKKKKTYDGPGYVIGYDGRIVSKKP